MFYKKAYHMLSISLFQRLNRFKIAGSSQNHYEMIIRNYEGDIHAHDKPNDAS